MLEFSNDLKVAMSFERSINEEQRNERFIPPNKGQSTIHSTSKNTSQTEAKETSKQTTNRENITQVKNAATVAAARQNPFKSAKEKFDSEGGQLAQEKTSSTNVVRFLPSIIIVNPFFFSLF